MARPYLFSLLLLLTLVEAGMLSFWRNEPGPYLSPFVWFFAGIGSALAAIRLSYLSKQTAEPPEETADQKKWRKFGVVTIFLVGSMICAHLLQNIFTAVPIDAGISDVIPSMQVYVRRWLNGENVYAPIYYDGWKVVPTYMPFLWMPYSLAEIFSFDYRWMAFGVFLLGLAFYYRNLVNTPAAASNWLVKALTPFLLLGILLADKHADIFGMSVELLPVGFYLILGKSLFHRKWWVVLVGILLSLLSRWAFTFWLPVYLIAFLIEKGWIPTLKLGTGLVVGVFFLFILPFLIPNWQTLSDEMKVYPRTAKGRWQTESWQQPGEKPFHLKQGLSFALFFYDYADGDAFSRLATNRRVHKWICISTGLLLLIGYFLVRHAGGDISYYFLAALKLYLVVFYGFFYVPFLYLYHLPLFMSVPLIMRYRRT